jgi:hypothetical protein
MKNLRIALGVRNTHSLRQNLLYFSYEKYAQFMSSITPSKQDLAYARALRGTGIANLGTADVTELAKLVEENLAQVPLVDGYAQLPRRYNPLLVPDLFRILLEKRGAIEACYRSHFRVNWFEVQKIAPGQQPPGSSFGYHIDDTPLPVIKLFIYLTDTGEANGAFRAFEYKQTDDFLRRGMLESVFPGDRRAKAQSLVTPEHERALRVVEGQKGTVFLFDNNLVHKGTLPRQGSRTHVSMEIMPSTVPLTQDALMKDCEKDIQVYFPPNPFRLTQLS